ncbi:MAG: DUF6029 family protein [Flavobacteriaceae bacterium]|nr:DUF6029 family protein [Flavobacteriaceae bacterium]
MKYFITAFFICSSILGIAQDKSFLNIGFETNSQWYVNDNRTGKFTAGNALRSNSYLNVNYNYDHFTMQVQFESYAPQALLNFSPNFTSSLNIATFSVNYETDKFNSTLGYFYEQFASGLIFRAYEDRQLGINNAIFGGLLHYKPTSFLSLKGFYGKQRKGFDLSKGHIYGINSIVSISEILKLKNSALSYEFSYVARYQNSVKTNPKFNKTTGAFSNAFHFNKNTFYSNIEYVYKKKDALVKFENVFDNRLFDGNALLFNTGFTYKNFSVDATFRRLENMTFYLNRNVNQNIFNDQRVNYLPSLTKQQDFSLANIYVYQSQPQLAFSPSGKSGEIGYQIDAFYKFKRGTTLGGKYGTQLALNYAIWYGLDAIYDLDNRTYTSKYLSFGAKYFSDLNLEIRKKWSKKLTTLSTFMVIYYNKELLEDNFDQINAWLFLSETSYKLTNLTSIRVKIEHLQTPNDSKNWWSASSEVYYKDISFYVSDLYNYGNTNDAEKIHYYNFGGSYSKNKSRLALNYGRQRGGLLCVGGVCRFVPRTTGYSLNFSTTF